MNHTGFPPGFLWGAATSAYQIEGATRVDGRGISIWDTFCSVPGKVFGSHSGEPACQHYFSYAEDIGMMRELGLNSYRFSLAWTRLMPEGRGKLNNKGLDFYRRLVDLLLENEIRPMATLYHWDLPQPLQNKGGWAHADTPKRFADYCFAVFGELDDVVPTWITINEPAVIAILGHTTGEMAPGHRDAGEGLIVAHHLLLAHGMAVRAFRDSSSRKPVVDVDASQPIDGIGIALSINYQEPATDAERDIAAAQRVDGFWNRLYLEPLFNGHYPEDILECLAQAGVLPDALARPQPEEMRTISQETDFLGINYYTRNQVAWDPADCLLNASAVTPRLPVTAMGWEVYPEGLFKVLKRVSHDYTKIPLFITENGAAFDDSFSPDGSVIDDGDRIEYLSSHFEAARRVCECGINLRGYYVWSLMDNFEWAHGYSKRFGLVHVDFQTQRRTLKRSAMWYRDFIRSQQ
jgi:beta-glucosidase